MPIQLRKSAAERFGNVDIDKEMNDLRRIRPDLAPKEKKTATSAAQK